MWWRWLKRPQDLWARLWRRKYTPITPEKELIIWNDQGSGSLIWNATKKNKGMITDHAFWELQDGTLTLSWSESWQQLPALDKDPTLSNYKPLTEAAGLLKVTDYWNHEENRVTWRRWKSTHEEMNIPPEVNLQPLLDKINSRKFSANMVRTS
jgi:hypothetical protein